MRTRFSLISHSFTYLLSTTPYIIHLCTYAPDSNSPAVHLLQLHLLQVTKLTELSNSEASTSLEHGLVMATALKWNERGTHLAVGTQQGVVQVWDVAAQSMVDHMSGHSQRVGVLAWNAESVTSGSRDREIWHRDVRVAQLASAAGATRADSTRRPQRVFNAHKQEVHTALRHLFFEYSLRRRRQLFLEYSRRRRRQLFFEYSRHCGAPSRRRRRHLIFESSRRRRRHLFFESSLPSPPIAVKTPLWPT